MAFCGVMSAVSVVILLLAGILPTLSYALTALAGISLTLLVMEFGEKYAVMSYIAIALISMLLLPDKEPALLFTLILGWYPIGKARFERIKPVWLEYLAKIAVFSILCVAFYYVTVWLFMPGAEFEGSFWEKYGLPLTFAAALAAFVLYDIALSKMITLYVQKYQQKLRKTILK